MESQLLPELVDIERSRCPNEAVSSNTLIKKLELQITKPLLNNSEDFQEAFYGRPEAFLQEESRKAQSTWNFLRKKIEIEYVKRLSEDLTSDEWNKLGGYYITGQCRNLNIKCTEGTSCLEL